MKRLITSIGIVLAATSSQAVTINVATGSASGTYSRVLKEAQMQCQGSVFVTEKNTSGSTENIDKISSNEVNGAFVQMDVLFYRSRTEELNVRTLLNLYPEEVHFVARNVAPKEKGMFASAMSMFSKEAKAINAVEDLNGGTVAAAGGSWVTASVIRLEAEIGYKVIEVGSSDEALAMVREGKVDAAVLVGGQRLGNVDALKEDFKLLPFSEVTVKKLKRVYNPAKLNYPKMRMLGVPSVMTNASFVVFNYKTPDYSKALLDFRGCILDNIAKIRETTGTHPKWRAIADDQRTNEESRGKWPWYTGGK